MDYRGESYADKAYRKLMQHAAEQQAEAVRGAGWTLGAMVVIAVGAGYLGEMSLQPEQKLQVEFQASAEKALKAESLTSASLGKFKKTHVCDDAARPYSARFEAQNKKGDYLEGYVCIGEGHSPVVKPEVLKYR